MKLEDRIKSLESESASLEPDKDTRKKWMDLISEYSDQFIESLDSVNAFDDNIFIDDVFQNDHYMEKHQLSELIETIRKNVDKPGLNPASGGHVGYIPGGGIFPTAIGDFIAAVGNKYAGMFFGGPGAVRMENALIKWMCKIIGFPDSAHGNLTSGGSIANLIAITTARDKKQLNCSNIPKSVIYLTSQTHHCVQKAIRIAGLHESIIRYIPLDDHYRMNADSLEKQISSDKENNLIPFLIVASAGTTDTGSVDPINKIAEISKENNCWLHIDAAYGGFFILVDELKEKFNGIEKADSVAIDPHKGLFLSYGLGVILMKDVEAMFNSHFYKAPYMQDAQEKYDVLSPADLSPELTKHYRGMRLWIPLKLFGIQPFIKALEEKRLLALYFYREIQKLGFEVGPEPDLSVVLYRFIDTKSDLNIFNKLLIEEIHKDGTVFLSSTKIDQREWLRAAILGFRTHLSTIDQCLEMIKSCVQKVKMRLQ